MDVAIVGAGIMGLSVARALLKRGHRVRIYDRGPIPNPLASSFDEHRLIRYPYGSMAGYATMMDDAYSAWEALWSDLGASYYHETGTLVLSRIDDGWCAASARVLDAVGHPYEWIEPEAVAERFPLLLSNGIRQAMWLSSGGFLRAADILRGLTGFVASAGAELFPETRIVRIDRGGGTAFAEDGTPIEAELLVVAAGAWSPALASEAAPTLRPSRQVVVYATPPEDQRLAWSTLPMLLDIDPGSGFYLVPPAAGYGLKIGDHRFSMVGDPDAPREATKREVDTVCQAARGRLRSFDRFRIDRGHVCFYTVAPEERFYVAREGRTWTMAGFSGHGFKFGALMGDRLAETLEGLIPEETLTRWAAGR